MRDWSAAQRLVIGGTSLLSKRPGRYVTDDSWPTFFRSCSGIKVKASCGKTYLDFSEFSIGCNLFGYGNPISRSFILKYLFSSPLCTLISPLESELASALNSLIGQNRSWKFARGGGESMAQAVDCTSLLNQSHFPIALSFWVIMVGKIGIYLRI